MNFFIKLIKISIFTWIAILIVVPLIAPKGMDIINSPSSSNAQKNVEPAQTSIVSQASKPTYKTFGAVVLKEIYAYPKHGFYLYEFEKGDTTGLTFLDKMANELKYSDANFLTVFIYDHEIDLKPFYNAPKQLPANLLVEADKQKPYMFFTSSKDLQENACDRWGLDYFYRNPATKWQWKPEIEEKAAEYCKYF